VWRDLEAVSTNITHQVFSRARKIPLVERPQFVVELRSEDAVVSKGLESDVKPAKPRE
jgi:hypothetical protein